jgi:hypothetical protein
LAAAAAGVSYAVAPEWTVGHLKSNAASLLRGMASKARTAGGRGGFIPGTDGHLEGKGTLSLSGPGLALTSPSASRVLASAHLTGMGLAARFTSAELASVLKHVGAVKVAKAVKDFAPRRMYSGIDLPSLMAPLSFGVEVGVREAKDVGKRLNQLADALDPAGKAGPTIPKSASASHAFSDFFGSPVIKVNPGRMVAAGFSEGYNHDTAPRSPSMDDALAASLESDSLKVAGNMSDEPGGVESLVARRMAAAQNKAFKLKKPKKGLESMSARAYSRKASDYANQD